MQKKIHMAWFQDVFALPFSKGMTVQKKSKKLFVFEPLAADNF